MFRRLSRLGQSLTSYLAPPSQTNAGGHCIAATIGRGVSRTSGRAVGNALRGVPRSASRRRFFTPLRVEFLERREVLTGSVSVMAMNSPVNEGNQASFKIQGSSSVRSQSQTGTIPTVITLSTMSTDL
jgi:hypothetical protein